MSDPDVLRTLFALAVLPVAPLWALMVAAPRWSLTGRLVSSPWSYTPLCAVYVTLAIPHATQLVRSIVVGPGLTDVAALLGTPWGATLAWLHFVAFDALVGRWIFMDSRQRDLSPVVMAPILVVTLLFGPLGYLTYVITRSIPRPRATS